VWCTGCLKHYTQSSGHLEAAPDDSSLAEPTVRRHISAAGEKKKCFIMTCTYVKPNNAKFCPELPEQNFGYSLAIVF